MSVAFNLEDSPLLRRLSDVFSYGSHFSLQDIEGFPYRTYQENLSRYRELEKWYSGDKLDETDMREGEEVELYPVKINPLPGAVMKHAAVLFGEIVDDGRPLVVPRVIPRDNDEEDKTRALEAEDALNMLWYENSGRALQLRNGALSQIYGGCIFKLTYVPWERWRTIPIRVEAIHPSSFVGIPDASDNWRLSEGWVVRVISARQAKKYNVQLDVDADDRVYLIERWDRSSYKTSINDMLASAKFRYGSREIVKDLGGVNTFGFVPMVYIPHQRVNYFYGEGLIENLIGIVKEINLRAADFGDAVSEDAHAWLAMRNVNGTPRVTKIAPGLNVIDLRSNPSVTGHEQEPDVFAVKKNSASAAMGELWEKLYEQFRRDACIPAVADGEDEGSQRSALTLAFRMWPLSSHVNHERTLWTTGMNWFNTMALRMMAYEPVANHMKEKGMPVITEEHARMRMKQDWAPMFPRDRQAIVDEIVQRATHNIGSIDHLLELTGDVEDVEAEKQKILDWLRELAKIAASENNMTKDGESEGESNHVD